MSVFSFDVTDLYIMEISSNICSLLRKPQIFNTSVLIFSASSMASRPGEAQSDGAPKTYRPLVKDYATDSGFDLSKVKHEVGAKETTTIAPPSYLQRRIPG